MPRLFRPWEQGLPELRTQLKKVDDLAYFFGTEKKILKERMRAAGFDPEAADTMVLTGRGRPMLAVFDLKTLTITAMFTAT